MNSKKITKLAVDILVDITGGMLIALGTYNFAAAAKFPMVGISGIALIFYHWLGLPIGVMSMVINIPIAVICFKTLGRDFFLRSVRSIIITSIIMDTVAPLLPVYHGEQMLAAICTGALSGLGFGLIYMRNSSTGGTDFIIFSIKAVKPHMSIGIISFGMEAVIIALGTVCISKSVDSMIYGLLISYTMSFILNKLMYGMEAGKMTLIITEHPEKTAEKINEIVERGATFLKAEGSYSGEERKVVMCACSNKEMYSIKTASKEIDRNSFMIVMESNEVVGNGFKE